MMTFNPAEMADRCLGIFQQTREIGNQLLEQDMNNVKPYDHEKPVGAYMDKNSYFNNANIIGYYFLNKGITGFSKIYYWELLKHIVSYEARNNKPLNKGMVCANYGVSDLAEGDIDGGIAHLLWSDMKTGHW